MTCNQPLVSIITPSFNQGEFIEQTILSVLGQDYPHIEYIVIDGGSTDQTLEILRKYGEQLTWVSEPDEGQSDAVNKGFRLARGDIVGWINADDVYFDHSAVEKVVKAFLDHPEADVVYGDFVEIDREGRITRIYPVPDFNYARLLRMNFVPQCTVFFRSKIARQYELDTSLEFVLDSDLFIRLGQKHTFYHRPELLACFRRHTSSKLHYLGDDLYQAERRLLRERYGVSKDWRYYLGRLGDRACMALLKAKGKWMQWRMKRESVSYKDLQVMQSEKD